jgi:hypothetical protein
VSVEGRNTTGLLDLSSLNWTRLADLRGLMRLRKLANGGVVPEGQRMQHLFWQMNFLMLARATTPQYMYSEAASGERD